MGSVVSESKKSSFVFIVVVFAVLLNPLEAFGGDWPNWRGPDYNGISKEKDFNPKFPDSGANILWQKSIGTGFSSISVSGGRVYTTGNSGTKETKNNKDNKDTIYCLDAETGKEIWTYSFLAALDPVRYDGGPNATPTVDGDKLYCFAREGDIFCFDAVSGDIIWQKNIIADFGLKPITYGYSSSPVIFKEMVLLNGGAHGFAFDKNNGKLLWKTSEESKDGYSTPVFLDIGKEKLILIFTGDALRCINLKDGKQHWEYPWETRHDLNVADPIISDDTVFISSGYGTGCALLKFDNSKVDLVWKNKEIRNHFNSSVLLDGYIYGFDEKTLKCLKLSDGSVAWSEKGLGKGSLMMADNKLIILSDDGLLVIANATSEKFDKISEAKILDGRCWTVPVLSGGKVYARNAKGDLVCVDMSSSK